MARKHKIGVFILLICVLAIQSIPVFQGMILEIHKSATWAAINNNNTATTSISVSPLDWQNISDKREIKHEGKMFDIKRVVVKDDKVLLEGHYDTVEDELLQIFKKLIHKDTQRGHAVAFCFFYYEQPVQYDCTNSAMSPQQKFNTVSDDFFTKDAIKALFRPPIV